MLVIFSFQRRKISNLKVFAISSLNPSVVTDVWVCTARCHYERSIFHASQKSPGSGFLITLFSPGIDDSVIDLIVISALGIITVPIAVRIASWVQLTTAARKQPTFPLIMLVLFPSKTENGMHYNNNRELQFQMCPRNHHSVFRFQVHLLGY